MILYIILYIYISNLIKDILDYLTFSLIYFTLFFSYPISLYLQILFEDTIETFYSFSPFVINQFLVIISIGYSVLMEEIIDSVIEIYINVILFLNIFWNFLMVCLYEVVDGFYINLSINLNFLKNYSISYIDSYFDLFRTQFIYLLLFCSLTILIISFSIILFLLINIAFATLAERKLMAAMQRRLGPNVVGFLGFLQPFADGFKLILKELIVPRRANRFLFILSPIIGLTLSIFLWVYLPVTIYTYNHLPLTVLYLLAIGALEVYSIIFAGWASNSRYALLGGIRSSAQMISYEIALSFIFLNVSLCSGSLDLVDIISIQSNGIWFLFPLLPLALIFLISILAETNRAPFDLPEAEAEIVAGYNVEYSGILFAFFFLGEYANMLFLSSIFVILFLGGWTFGSLTSSSPIIDSFIFSAKSICILIFFIWIRATFPRYRYDQLMSLGWTIFSPFTFGFFIFTINILYLTLGFPHQYDGFVNTSYDWLL